MDTIATALRELSLDNEELSFPGHTVVSNDDLLSEILLRLPVISLVLFKSVSKRWCSLINHPAFIKRRSLIPKIDPPSALFIRYAYELGIYGSVPFDTRIPWRLVNNLKSVPGSCTSILQSCNGLFLCYVMHGYRICVYNPTLNLFKMLPEPLDYESKHINFTRMDFDPTKSPHYKVVHATHLSQDGRFRIQTYSSETGVWSIVCNCTDPVDHFCNGIYWNDVIHWLHDDNDYSDRTVHYKLDLKNKNVTPTKIQLPITVVDSSCKLFESRGCLVLIGKDNTHSDQMNVYEMRNGHSEWSMKYSVDHSRINLGIDCVKCIYLGEREEDSFMVRVSYGEGVYVYKFALKTFHEHPDFQSLLSEGVKIGSKVTYVSLSSFLFTASFASV